MSEIISAAVLLILIMDPLGNLILQYPVDAEPMRFRKDLSRLIYNSRIG